jgi:NADH dehydrogenase
MEPARVPRQEASAASAAALPAQKAVTKEEKDVREVAHESEPTDAPEKKTPERPATKRVVVLGAGIAGLLAAQELRRKGVAVTLVSAREHFCFLPRLTELAAKSVRESKVLLSLREIWPGELKLERATLINPEDKTVVLESGANVPYDALVIAIGSETNYFNTPGANHAFPFYCKADADALLAHCATMLDADEGAGGTHTFSVVGGGPTGVEVMNVLAKIVKQKRPNARLLLIERGAELLSVAPKLAADVRGTLTKNGVEIITKASVTNITPLAIDVVREGENKETIPCTTTVWAAGSKPASIPISGVTPTARGEVPVSATLQVPNHPELFALGDVAATGTPKTAQSAVQQARQVAENVEAYLQGKEPKPFVYKERGVMIALDADTCALVFGKRIKGFLAKKMRDTYYSMTIGQYS